jgi:hypothetical protein
VTDDEYLTRVALHGNVTTEDVPGDVELTDEELDHLVEILYVRERDEYRVLSRHRQTLFLDHGGGPFDEFKEALANSIEIACSEDLPILQRIYTYVPERDDNELGVNRIPIPWDNETNGERSS